MKLKWSLLLALGLLLSVFLVACGGGDDSSEGTTDETEETTEGESTEGESTEAEGEKVLNLINGDTIPSMDPSMATDEYGLQFLGATMDYLPSQ